jgi:hypothetical protein
MSIRLLLFIDGLLYIDAVPISAVLALLAINSQRSQEGQQLYLKLISRRSGEVGAGHDDV